MKIFIGTDHNGIETKDYLISELNKLGYEVVGTKLVNSEGDDYPKFAIEVANNVARNSDSLGVLICGNGIGMSIVANKIKGIRCARCVNSDDARKAKEHNGANMVSFGGLSNNDALDLVLTFINTPSAHEERHLRRVDMIKELDK